MKESNVVVVHLRRPREKTDLRSDPFWEFGSFGITTCHAKNLLNPKRVNELVGVRLAFAQGGKHGIQLVFLTPPIHEAIPYQDRSEVLWTPHSMPFRYGAAPLLIEKSGRSDFPFLKHSFKEVSRRTWEGKFSSKFRSRRKPLAQAEAEELIQMYEIYRIRSGKKSIAQNYVDALPRHLDPVEAAERQRKYEGYREEADRASKTRRVPCGKTLC